MKNIFGIVAVLLILVGCGQKTSETPSFQETQLSQGSEETLSVVASFYPLAYIAERIGGDNVAVRNLVGSSDPHDYTLSPQDIVGLQEADVVFLHGAGLEPWAEDIENQLKNESVPVTVVTEEIILAPAREDEHHDEDEHDDEESHTEGEHDEHDEHGGHDDHADHEEEGHDAHDHGEFDPHVWLDPVGAQDMVDVIVAAMIAADVSSADQYTANAAVLKDEFQNLHTQYEAGLATCERRDVIISHDAFGYLADRYNFTAHNILGLSTQDEPSAQTLAQLKDEAAEGSTHILTEENTAGRFARTLSDETGLDLLPINALASTTSDEKDFLDRSRDNLTTFQTALGCAS